MSDEPKSDAPAEAGGESKRMTAAILGILLGGLGVHRFYLGDTKGGIIRLVISVCTFGAGGVIGIVEGIMYLMKTDADFIQTYQIDKKQWF